MTGDTGTRQGGGEDMYANGDPRLTVRERNWLGDQGQAQIERKFDRLADLLEAARGALTKAAG